MREYIDIIREKIGHDLLIVTGSNVIIQDDKGNYLLQQRKNGNWGLLGGLNEVGESLEETAIREVYEESGLHITQLQQIHTFSGKKFIFKLENQDQIQAVSTLFLAEKISGQTNLKSDETLDLKYFSYASLPKNIEAEYMNYLSYFEKNKNNFQNHRIK